MPFNEYSCLGYARKSVVFLIGVSVVIIGIVMLVAPGPGLLVIPAGLAILALEFAWAKRLLLELKRQEERALVWLSRYRTKRLKERN